MVVLGTGTTIYHVLLSTSVVSLSRSAVRKKETLCEMPPPPWAIYASDAGQGTGVLSTEAHNIGGGRTAEPQWPRLDRQLDLVGDRLKENSNHARRNLVWFDQNTTRLPSLNARAMEGG